MKTLKFICLLFIGFAFIIGCRGNYAKIRQQTSTEEEMTLVKLKENWEDYHIYSGTRGGRPRAQSIMFDPKNNGIRVIGDTWIKIADQPSLSEAIGAIQYDYDYAKVLIIEGPDGRFFGYMYSSTFHNVKIVDEQTLYLDEMSGWPPLREHFE